MAFCAIDVASARRMTMEMSLLKWVKRDKFGLHWPHQVAAAAHADAAAAETNWRSMASKVSDGPASLTPLPHVLRLLTESLRHGSAAPLSNLHRRGRADTDASCDPDRPLQ